MVPVVVARAVRWVAYGLRLLTGLTALALALTAGHAVTPAVGLAAPCAGATCTVFATSRHCPAPATAVPAAASATAVPAGALPAGEPVVSGGSAWIHLSGVDRRWTAAPTMEGERGVADAARMAKERALDGPVGQRAPPHG